LSSVQTLTFFFCLILRLVKRFFSKSEVIVYIYLHNVASKVASILYFVLKFSSFISID